MCAPAPERLKPLLCHCWADTQVGPYHSFLSPFAVVLRVRGRPRMGHECTNLRSHAGAWEQVKTTTNWEFSESSARWLSYSFLSQFVVVLGLRRREQAALGEFVGAHLCVRPRQNG